MMEFDFSPRWAWFGSLLASPLSGWVQYIAGFAADWQTVHFARQFSNW